jgi:DNA-binding Xre family transcriptional regulator
VTNSDWGGTEDRELHADIERCVTVDADSRARKASLEIRCHLASNLKQMRCARGYTREKLAELCQLRSYISDIEQATVNITLANLEALARELGCTERELLTRSATPHLLVERQRE